MPRCFRFRGVLAAIVGLSVPLWADAPASRPARVNVLLITADDMNWHTPGCFGDNAPDVTPNIDRLAASGMRFLHAHVTIAVCQPSRETLMTGRYPHRHGGEGFQPIRDDVPTLPEQLRRAGYLNGILGKVNHLAPPSKFPWDNGGGQSDLGAGRNPQAYYRESRAFFDRAARENRPFFFMANSHDPHRPFSGSEQERASDEIRSRMADIPAPSRRYAPDEVRVPGFLPDLPDIRREVAEYCSSARRCDDTVGAVLRALRESGLESQTLVMFLSDNGMSFPFAKANCYLNSTRTPWIVRWPGRVRPGAVNDRHFISGIDFMPTVLEAVGLPGVGGMDGVSFLPLLRGEDQSGRDACFTEFHETSARNRYPMRCVQTAEYGYLVNFWADGRTVYRNEAQSGLTFRAMEKAAQSDSAVADRVAFFRHRVREELYCLKDDPDCLHNRIDDPRCREAIERLRAMLLSRMEKTGDPALDAFRCRNSPEAVERFIASERAKSDARKETRRENRRQRPPARDE